MTTILQSEPSSDTPPGESRDHSIARRHDLDALRAIAMLLGIVLHAALAYYPLPDDGWPVHDARQHEAFGVFVALIHGFRMPLFFLLSGFFTAMLWRKRGLGALVKHRFKRIFLPLAIGLFTIVPAVWIASIGAGMTAVSKSPETDLWRSAATNDIPGIEAAIAAGGNLNAQQPVSGLTPLAAAAARGHVKALELLLSSGAKVDARDRDGSTALHRAAFFGEPKAAALLVQEGAPLDARNLIGETPADMLSIRGLRMLALAAQGEGDVEDLTGRTEVATILVNAGGTALPTPAVFATKEETRLVSSFFFLLATLFPLFHHLWFLWFLCWLVAVFAICAMLAPGLPKRFPTSLVNTPWCLAWLIPLTVVPQAMMGLLYSGFGPDTSTGLLPLPQILFYYAVFFLFGALYFDHHQADDRIGRWWRVTIPAALLVVFPVGYELSTGSWGLVTDQWLDSGWCRPAAIGLQVVYVWLMTFGLMGMFRELFSRESRLLRYISDSAYWLYLAHLPLIIVAQAVVRQWPIPALAKVVLICAVCSGLLLLSYEYCVRYTLIGTLLNGPRNRPS